MSELSYRAYEAGDEGALRRLLEQSFDLPAHRWSTLCERVGRDCMRVVAAGERVVGGCGFYDVAQWFGGKRVPLAAVCLVGVAPDARGRAVASHLMRSLVNEAHERGTPLSALYASTQGLYRKAGYEQAGVRYGYSIDLSDIGVRDRALEVAEIDPADPVLRALDTERARRGNGLLVRNEALWARVFDPGSGGPIYAYRAGPVAAAEGYIVFQQRGSGGIGYDLDVRDLVASTGRAARRLLTLLADHATLARTASWFGPAVDPLLLHTPEVRARIGRTDRWMLRLTHVERALAARGYAPGATGTLALEVEDEVVPANRGRFVLEVADGCGRVTRGGHGPAMRLGVGALATLYAGLFPARDLRAHGWADADDAATTTAERLFEGPAPWMAEMF